MREGPGAALFKISSPKARLKRVEDVLCILRLEDQVQGPLIQDQQGYRILTQRYKGSKQAKAVTKLQDSRGRKEDCNRKSR